MQKNQHQVILTLKAKKNFLKLPKTIQNKCLNVLETLKTNPLLGKKLKGVLSPLRSVRMVNYRLVYTINNNKLIIFVVGIRHRKEIYQKLSTNFSF